MSDSTGRKRDGDSEPKTKELRSNPGRSIREREEILISKAYDLVERRIDKGTATSQEVTHFLELGSSLAQLKRAKLENETALLKAKADEIKEAKKVSELYAEALAAMRKYSGHGSSNE